MVKALEQETKTALKKYAIGFGVAVLIAFLVIWSDGFFAHSAAVNLQITADAFFVSGVLMSLFAGLLFVSGEGALIGISYVLRNVVLTFIPMGRAKHERYADYRARKLGQAKKHSLRYILIPGLSFLLIGIILTAVWSTLYYQ